MRRGHRGESIQYITLKFIKSIMKIAEALCKLFAISMRNSTTKLFGSVVLIKPVSPSV